MSDDEYICKLSGFLSEKTMTAEDEDIIPVTVFFDERNKENVKRIIHFSGCTIKKELSILCAFSLDAKKRIIEDLACSEYVRFIAAGE